MDTLAAEAGWSFEQARNLGQLRAVGLDRTVVAVLIDANALCMPPEHALQAVLDILPEALPIVCHKSSEAIHWSELARVGAFHALLMPLRASEVRQSLGFVGEAHQRRRSRLVMLRPRPPVSDRGTKSGRDAA
jgi:hypothetical protein